MRAALTAFIAGILTALSAHAAGFFPLVVPPYHLNINNYTLTFADDFSTTLSISDTGQGTTWAWNKPDLQNFGDVGWSDVFSTSGGILSLEIYLDSMMNWHAGIMASVQTLSGPAPGTGFTQQYGYWEMRAKFPGNGCTPNGGSTWPAFWLLAANHITSNLAIDDVEIDIIEQFGNFMPCQDNMTYHHWISPTPVVVQLATDPGDMTSGYHTYGVSIDAVNIIWYFDRVEQARIATPIEANTPMYVLVDMACSGSPPCGDANTPNPGFMQVDYVHVYQHN